MPFKFLGKEDSEWAVAGWLEVLERQNRCAGHQMQTSDQMSLTSVLLTRLFPGAPSHAGPRAGLPVRLAQRPWSVSPFGSRAGTYLHQRPQQRVQ